MPKEGRGRMGLLKICRCGKLITQAERQCPACKEKQLIKDKSRHKRYDNSKRHTEDNQMFDHFYKTKEWRITREVAIARDHALCQDCLKDNRIRAFNSVHHINPLKEAWSQRSNLTNLVCLCARCHQERHKQLT
jgi:5-methylcytosine-specific restriction endonuclease McrA